MDESEGISAWNMKMRGSSAWNMKVRGLCLKYENEGSSACSIKVTHEGLSAWNMKGVMGAVDGVSTH